MIVVVDYGLGNLASIANMLRKVGASAVVSSDPAVIQQAGKLILPGVGAFDAGMQNLEERGLVSLLTVRAAQDHIPVLGICLGMQLLGMRSEEGTRCGLGWINGNTIRLPAQHTLKIPHMGWNSVTVRGPHPLFAGLEAENRFYFVHSYHLVCSESRDVIGSTAYGCEFTASVAKGNVMGVQFHPEKSHRFGMQLLKNFANL